MGMVWTVVAVGVVGFAAVGVSRDGFRQPRGAARWLGAVILGWSWVTLGVEILGMAGRLRAVPLVLWATLALAAATVLRVARPGSDPPASPVPASRPGLAATLAVGLVLWASLRIGLTALLFPVKVVSDGPIYHLYFAARWWKEGRLFPVATPFGEAGATYFWANGDLWFTWLMALWGGDRLAKLGQVPFLAVAAGVAFAMARRFGAGLSSSLIASIWFAMVGPLFLYAFEPNVDVLFVAGYLLAAYFFLRHAIGDDGDASLILGSLAAGLTMATKPTGVVFVPPLVGLAVVGTLARGGPAGRKVARVGLILLASGLTSVYWPARNAWLTGSPLYPLRVEVLGRVWLPGWFGRSAMSRSHYYIPVLSWRAFVDTILAVLDPRLIPLWLASLAGAWRSGRRDPARDRWVWGISALAVANVALYWLAIPYRTQQRFMLQAMGLAAVPLALTLDRGRWARAVAVALLALHVITPQGWPLDFGGVDFPWDLHPGVPNRIPPTVPVPLDAPGFRRAASDPAARVLLRLTLAMGVGSVPLAFAWARLIAKADPARWATALVGTAGLAAVGGWVLGGVSTSPYPGFVEYIRGWSQMELRLGPRGARVAYAGTKIPYYLLGGGMRNEVRYVNVNEHRDWLMHDYHGAAGSRGLPSTWPDPFPGWDRMRPDYASWLANLRAEGIELLVVNRVNPDEGMHNVADRDGFPIERAWADGHPEAFQPLYGVAERDPSFRLYRVLPGNYPRSSTESRARSH